MGTKRLGFSAGPANNNQFYWQAYSGGNVLKSDNGYSTSDEMYIDEVDFYCGSHSGTQWFQFAVYSGTGPGGALLGGTPQSGPYGVGFAFNSGRLSPGSFIHVNPNTTITVAAFAPTNIQTAGMNDGGSFYFNTNQGWTNPYSGTFKSWGSLAWYVMYFPKATISNVTNTPVFPGQTFDVFGQSFSAGVTAVKLGGQACSGVNVLSDTHLTAVVPTGATTGKVEVDTYAGNATSGSNLTVSGGRIFHSGGLVSAQSVRVAHNSGLVQVSSIRTARMVNGSLVLTDVH